jgi:hypothetical protein
MHDEREHAATRVTISSAQLVELGDRFDVLARRSVNRQ